MFYELKIYSKSTLILKKKIAVISQDVQKSAWNMKQDNTEEFYEVITQTLGHLVESGRLG